MATYYTKTGDRVEIGGSDEFAASQAKLYGWTSTKPTSTTTPYAAAVKSTVTTPTATVTKPSTSSGTSLSSLGKTANTYDVSDYYKTPAVYATAIDYELNKSKYPNLKLYNPNTTKLQSGDYFLGGAGAVGSPTDEALRSVGINPDTNRIYGDDRYETAAALDDFLMRTNAQNQAALQIEPQIQSLLGQQDLMSAGYEKQIAAIKEALKANQLSAKQDVADTQSAGMDAIAQVRRLNDINRNRLGEIMNSKGLLNSGIYDSEQDKISAGEQSGVLSSQSQTANLVKQIQDKIAQMQEEEAAKEEALLNEQSIAVRNLQNQILGLEAQRPVLANTLYQAALEKAQADAAAQQKYADEKAYKEAELAYKEAELLGNYMGIPTLEAQKILADIQLNKDKMTQDQSQFLQSLAIQQQNADTSRLNVAGTITQVPSEIPSAFWSEATNIGSQYGVDPLLLAAIAKHETGYGTLGAGRDGYSLGVGVYDSGNPNSNYKDAPGTYTKQLTWAANSIANKFPGEVNLENLKAYQKASGYATDPNWANKVWESYKGLASQAVITKAPSATDKKNAALADAINDIRVAVNAGTPYSTIKGNIIGNILGYQANGIDYKDLLKVVEEYENDPSTLHLRATDTWNTLLKNYGVGR